MSAGDPDHEEVREPRIMGEEADEGVVVEEAKKDPAEIIEEHALEEPDVVTVREKIDAVEAELGEMPTLEKIDETLQELDAEEVRVQKAGALMERRFDLTEKLRQTERQGREAEEEEKIILEELKRLAPQIENVERRLAKTEAAVYDDLNESGDPYAFVDEVIRRDHEQVTEELMRRMELEGHLRELERIQKISLQEGC